MWALGRGKAPCPSRIEVIGCCSAERGHERPWQANSILQLCQAIQEGYTVKSPLCNSSHSSVSKWIDYAMSCCYMLQKLALQHSQVQMSIAQKAEQLQIFRAQQPTATPPRWQASPSRPECVFSTKTFVGVSSYSFHRLLSSILIGKSQMSFVQCHFDSFRIIIVSIAACLKMMFSLSTRSLTMFVQGTREVLTCVTKA